MGKVFMIKEWLLLSLISYKCASDNQLEGRGNVGGSKGLWGDWNNYSGNQSGIFLDANGTGGYSHTALSRTFGHWWKWWWYCLPKDHFLLIFEYYFHHVGIVFFRKETRYVVRQNKFKSRITSMRETITD